MKCWYCNGELIWGGDHDIDEETEDYSIVTNLTCSECGAYVECYLPKEEKEVLELTVIDGKKE
jgi:hypothetical protein|tara:strand:+ start:115 stop:303 length:189 start_codon:yes stop_codon:yes gene_type:complete